MTKDWRIPILTYHALHAPGWSYAENDHVALEQDLEVIRALGFKVMPLTDLVNLLVDDGRSTFDGDKLVALTFDDGTDHDYLDFSHPDYGHLKSFRRVLVESRDLGTDGSIPSATSFVIASPEARSQLDKTCIAGRDQWRDTWWKEAAAEGLLGIANHSWDHLHPSLDHHVACTVHDGRFDSVADFMSADEEIQKAQRYILHKTDGLALPFFAYPFGQYNDFLAFEYFPSRQNWFKAAFTTAGRHVTPSDSQWLIPRYVCGEHWKSPEELQQLLN